MDVNMVVAGMLLYSTDTISLVMLLDSHKLENWMRYEYTANSNNGFGSDIAGSQFHFILDNFSRSLSSAIPAYAVSSSRTYHPHKGRSASKTFLSKVMVAILEKPALAGRLVHYAYIISSFLD